MLLRLLRRAFTWPFLLLYGLALSLFALLSPQGARSWSVFLRGSVYPRAGDESSTLRCRSAALAIDRVVSGTDGYCVLAEGAPGASLEPAGTLTIEVPGSDGAPAQVTEIALSRLFERPLQGYVELLVDREAVVARVMAYTWGGSLSFCTGQTHRRTRRLNEIRIPFTTLGT